MNEKNFRSIRFDRDWQKDKPDFKEGEIYIIQDLRWLIDERHWSLVLRKLGDCVDDSPDVINIQYV